MIQLKEKFKATVKNLVHENPKLDWVLFKRTAPPAVVAIETSTWCNRRCSYCPNSVYDRGLKQNERLLSSELHEKIIHDLKSMNFKGKLSYQFYGEPLLDKRLPDFIRTAKRILGPEAYVTFSTNGDLLTQELLKDFSDMKVTKITVSIHDPEIKPQLKRLLQEVEEKNWPTPPLHIKHLKNHKMMFNRGGLLKVDKDLDFMAGVVEGCDKATHMQLNAEGQMILCCNDYLSQYVMGRAGETTLANLWKRSEKLRGDIFTGTFDLDICRKCVSLPGEGVKPEQFKID